MKFDAAFRGVDERIGNDSMPFLSHSRISKYVHCPEQYRLYYVEGLRPRVQGAELVFGQFIHQSLAVLFRDGSDPVDFFERAWNEVKKIDLAYGAREPWEKLRDAGRTLLERFVAEEVPRIGDVEAVEKPFEISVTSLDVPFVGVIDLVAALDGKRTVVDYKTSGSSYQPYQVAMSDQLTAYQLARPDAEQAAFCVLVKVREPRIEWHLATRNGEQLTEYLAKAGLVGREIAAGHFYKRPGKWCTWCDFLPVCLGDKKKTEETLVQTR